MKILKRRGKAVASNVLQLTCAACSTEIECSTSEMTLQASPDGEQYDYLEIKCPSCDRPITKEAHP